MLSQTVPLLAVALLLVGCSANTQSQSPESQPTEQIPTTTAAASEPTTEPETSAQTAGSATKPTAEQVAARVAAAEARLATSEGGALVWRSIATHGGLEGWLGSGPLHFRFAYQPIGRPATDTFQIVDPWSSRARHQVAPDKAVEFGWDGQRAWVNPPDAELTTNARFWSLTPYYFLGMPFVLADPGSVFEKLPDATFEGRAYDIVKVTFEAGTGDAPGDYYVLYLDKKNGRLRALRYVVSYPGFRPEGGHGPEKLMSYDGELVIGDIFVASAHRTFSFDEETQTVGEKVTDVAVSEAEFRPDIEPDYFAAPSGARLIDGWK